MSHGKAESFCNFLFREQITVEALSHSALLVANISVADAVTLLSYLPPSGPVIELSDLAPGCDHLSVVIRLCSVAFVFMMLLEMGFETVAVSAYRSLALYFDADESIIFCFHFLFQQSSGVMKMEKRHGVPSV